MYIFVLLVILNGQQMKIYKMKYLEKYKKNDKNKFNMILSYYHIKIK